MAKSVPAQYQLRMKQHMKVVEFASLHGIKPASRHFGLDLRTVRTWLRHWRLEGTAVGAAVSETAEVSLEPGGAALTRVARFEHEWGAPRTQVWLSRVHGVYVSAATIQREFRVLGRPRLLQTKPRRRPCQLRLFEKERPGDSVQVDVKVVK